MSKYILLVINRKWRIKERFNLIEQWNLPNNMVFIKFLRPVPKLEITLRMFSHAQAKSYSFKMRKSSRMPKKRRKKKAQIIILPIRGLI
jgi:hypothetical protein